MCYQSTCTRSPALNEYLMTKDFSTTNPKFLNTQGQSGSILPIWHYWCRMLQGRLILGHVREYSQTTSFFPPISLRSHPCLSLPQVSLLFLLLLPSPLSSSATSMPVCIIVFLQPLIPRPKVLCVWEISAYLFDYLANNVDTTVINKEARMVCATPWT